MSHRELHGGKREANGAGETAGKRNFTANEKGSAVAFPFFDEERGAEGAGCLPPGEVGKYA